MTYRTRYKQVEPMRTRDGSMVRELMHPQRHSVKNQSFAEATLEPGQHSALHRHLQAEEIYHFLSGNGEMLLGDDMLLVEPGDTVCIPPETPHALKNLGENEMRVVCCCSPPYDNEDTELL